MSAQAGGLCMSQWAHWRIPLFFTREKVETERADSLWKMHANPLSRVNENR